MAPRSSPPRSPGLLPFPDIPPLTAADDHSDDDLDSAKTKKKRPDSIRVDSLPLSTSPWPLSASPSNEADDEGSSSGTSIMGPHLMARYPGEDTRPTTNREIAGFYAYGWAVEVFVVCGIGSFIPLTLEQLARARGFLFHDPTVRCDDAPEGSDSTCVVNFFGVDINTASFAMYTFSLSVLVQAIVLISVSGAADHGRFRKSLLLVFAFTGAIATMLFLPLTPGLYLVAAFLAIVANTCFGASFALLNSFLPLLVRYHPNIQFEDATDSEAYISGADSIRSRPDEGEPESFPTSRTSVEIQLPDDHHGDGHADNYRADATTSLLAIQSQHSAYHGGDVGGHEHDLDQSALNAEAAALSAQISAYGIGIGYTAAVVVQTLSVFIIALVGQKTFSLLIVLFIIGAWWFVFTIPAIFWLRPRPGPPLELAQTGRWRAGVAYFSYSWRSLGRTVMYARNLKDVVLFLGAWFLLSDGIATVSGTAILFAKTQLNMQLESLALINVIVTISGIIGAFSWSRISRLAGLRPNQTILVCICVFELIPLYGLLGYVPFIRRLGYLGLQNPIEMYPLGAVYGLLLGGLSSYCRSLFGQLIPPGFEAAFFALYAITDKGSSVFGPAIVGLITDRAHDIRPAFWFLAVLVGLPFPLMYMVDVDRGRRDGLAIARQLEAQKLRDSAINNSSRDGYGTIFGEAGSHARHE